MADAVPTAAAPLLAVHDLCAGYGSSQVLDHVSFAMGVEAVAIIGRNGMGKSTLCNTLMGFVPATCGHGRARRHDAVRPGDPSASPRRASPTCRRVGGCSASLTVDEHLAMLAKAARAASGGHRRRLRAVPAPRPTPAQPAPARCPAASSRCWPSPGRCSSTGRW